MPNLKRRQLKGVPQPMDEYSSDEEDEPGKAYYTDEEKEIVTTRTSKIVWLTFEIIMCVNFGLIADMTQTMCAKVHLSDCWHENIHINGWILVSVTQLRLTEKKCR